MTFHPAGSRARRSAKRLALVLEALEDRLLPSCTLTLTSSEPSPQLVGEPITWTATPSDCLPDLVYQFRVSRGGGASEMVRDFSPLSTFSWAPMREGNYEVTVLAKAGYHGTEIVSASAPDEVDTRVTGTDPVVTATANPLVALFSVPPDNGGMVKVEFRVLDAGPLWRSTDYMPDVAGESTNILVAGMLPETTYQMRSVKSTGGTSRPLIFRTGSLPTNVDMATFTVTQPPGPESDLKDDMVLHWIAQSVGNTVSPIATDLQGRVEWYYNNPAAGLSRVDSGSLLSGGTVLLQAADPSQPFNGVNIVREIDLAGNPLRETNLEAVNAQLLQLGHQPTFGFHHDAQRLPDGSTALLAHTRRLVSVNGQTTTYEGDMVIVLDRDFQVRWAWDAFDYLDINRGPILHETDTIGVDWLHSNSVSYSPADGNLLVSMRHQDWVIKIDYADGTGDGHVIWRLGKDGDFTANSSSPYPWFSHQHNVHYIDANTLAVFDNGNSRVFRDPSGHSRGQTWLLDERTMTATPELNADLGVYSFALGASELLPNGDFSFTAGALNSGAQHYGQTFEVRPDGSIVYVLQENQQYLYRSYRINNLYDGDGTAPTTSSPNVVAAGPEGGDPDVSLPQVLVPPLAGALLGPVGAGSQESGTPGVTARVLMGASSMSAPLDNPLTVPAPASIPLTGGTPSDSLFADLGAESLTDGFAENLGNWVPLA